MSKTLTPAGAQRERRLLQLGGLVAAAAAIVLAVVLLSGGGGGGHKSAGGAGLQGTAAAQATFAGIPQQGVTLGRATAPVTIVEFADPQCPFCAQFSRGELPALVRGWVRTGKARLQLRLMTFLGPDSVAAARTLEAAGLQNRLWNAVDVLYANQGEENSGYVTDAFLRSVLGAVPGLAVDRATADAAAPRVTGELNTTAALAARYGVQSTPSFVVGRTGGTLRRLSGPPTAAAIGAAVDRAAA